MSRITEEFKDGARVSHSTKGLGSVAKEPAQDGLVVSAKEETKTGPDMVYVVWDDDRFPVGKVSVDELELLPPAAAAMSSGV